MKTTFMRWAKFLSPGMMVAEDFSREVDSLDPNAVEWPDRAYCFTLHEREDIHVDGKVFQGQTKQVGPTYYHPDSKVETLTEVLQNPDAGPCLAQNMMGNNWDRVIWSRWGNWPQPFDPETCEVLK